MGAADLTEFEQANGRPGPRTCKVHVALRAMDDEQRRRFIDACEANHIQHQAIASVLAGWDLPVDVTPFDVTRFRKRLEGRTGGCKCPGTP